jgi:hypothetical protein
VLPVKQDIHGIILLVLVHVVNYQELLLEINVFVHHQKLFGVMQRKPVHVQQILLEIIVFHVQLPEFGIQLINNVYVQAQLMSGMEINAFVQPIDLDQIVLNAQPQEDGIQLPINVFVTHHLSGMVKIVFVLNHTFYIKEDVENAPMDSNGLIIDVNNVTATTKILKPIQVFEIFDKNLFVYFIFYFILFYFKLIFYLIDN